MGGRTCGGSNSPPLLLVLFSREGERKILGKNVHRDSGGYAKRESREGGRGRKGGIIIIARGHLSSFSPTSSVVATVGGGGRGRVVARGTVAVAAVQVAVAAVLAEQARGPRLSRIHPIHSFILETLP